MPNTNRDALVTAYQRNVSQRRARLPSGFRVAERQRFSDHLTERGAKSILEIGCGAGHDAVFYQDQGFQVRAIDTTPGLVDEARSQGVDVELLDVYDLHTHSATYDAIFSVNCLLHIPNADITTVFAAIADRLHPDGTMYLGLWGGRDTEGIHEADSYEPKRFFSFRSAETLIGLLQDRFRLDYFQRFVAEGGHVFNSLILTKRDVPERRLAETKRRG